ncbi:MAG: MFS transporter [Actinomycetota bacterium]|nr:MFS transporter [Actinomycetota bacterium]
MPIPVLSVLAAAVFAAITTEVLPVGLLPIISRDLGTSESRVGLLVSAYAVVVALGSIPLTAVMVRWPRKQVLSGLLVIYAISNALLAGTDQFSVALIARLVGGLAHAGFFSIVIAAAIGVVAPAKAGRAVAVVQTGNALALSVGIPLGTALGTAVGWRWAFAGAAVLMMLLAVLTAIVLPTGQGAPKQAGVPVLTAVRGRPLMVVAGLVIALTLGHYTLFTYVSPLLLNAGVGITSVGVVLFCYGAGGIIGLVLAGIAVDRWLFGTVRAAITVTFICLLILGLFHATSVVIIAVAMWGCAFGSLPTLLQTIAIRAAPQTPDAGPAVVNATFNVGIAGGALIGGRELLVAAPPVLALTAAALVAVSLLLLQNMSRAATEPPSR